MIYKLVGAVALVVAVGWQLWTPSKPERRTALTEDYYDYVVVGAGSAGGALATRLSEDPDVTVALLEAGPDNDDFPETDVPPNFINQRTSDLDWNYETERQTESCHGLLGNMSPWPRGRSLGGSSMMNCMMAIRGSRHDYDLWERMGNKGWGFKDVLPYFKKIEEISSELDAEKDYRGSEGPVQVSQHIIYPDVVSSFLEASKAYGLEIKDLNGYDNIGMMANQANIRKGVRQSTAKAYLKPVMPSRPNLHVLTEAHAAKVLFEGKRAVGVQYVHRGFVRSVRCRKEVILSAGAIGSPHILLLSGVGPKEHLEEMKIPVVADLPVGENLQDHIMNDAIVYTMDKPVTMVQDRIGTMDNLKYKWLGTGSYSQTGIVATGFVRSKSQPADREDPYIQYILFNTMYGNDRKKVPMRFFGYRPEVFDALYHDLEGRDGITLWPVLLHPKSIGTIRLRTVNPFDHPIIDPQYLTDQQDVDVLVDAIRIGQKIMESKPLKKLGTKRLVRVNPQCANHTYDSDAYWECYVKSITFTVYHPVGTCTMGPKGDPTAVVDPQLRVHGLQGLRVADASIMPTLPSGNTNFPSMMVGERAAGLIINGR